MKPLTYHIYKGLFLSGIVPPKVIVQIDGGICSQMHQYFTETKDTTSVSTRHFLKKEEMI